MRNNLKKYLTLAILVLCLIIAPSFLIVGCKEDPPIEYKNILFIVEGNIYSTTQNKGSNDTVLPQEPTKTNHYFNGWYTDSSLTTQLEMSYLNDVMNSDIYLYAKFVEKEYITLCYHPLK